MSITLDQEVNLAATMKCVVVSYTSTASSGTNSLGRCEALHLSAEEQERFLAALNSPAPPPSQVLRLAAERFKRQYS
jgi:hypothetical protein